MSSLPVASAKPDIVAVNDLLDMVVSGEYRIPRFQRPYVWTPDDMLQLFDSVVKSYPIGSLLIWQTERSDISSLDEVGPIPIPNAGPILKSYVVDGHQRLATLLGVLKLPEDYPSDKMENWRWWIAYDLQEQNFIHLKNNYNKNIPLHYLPLRSVLRTVDFARRTREIAASKDIGEEEIGILLDRADRLQRSVREYRLPMTVMRSGSLDDAVTIFARVNQRGRDMTADQMISALTYRDSSESRFDLAASIDDLLGQLRAYGFGDLHRRVILQAVLALAGLDFTRPSYERIVDRNSYPQMAKAVSLASTALGEAAVFLNQEVGLHTSRLLPYSSIFVLLSIFFGEARDANYSIDGEVKGLIKKWFWATSFNGWFAGATTTDIRRAADIMRGLAHPDFDLSVFEREFLNKQIRPFPASFDRRSARIRASLLMQIVEFKPRDPGTGEQLDGSAIFANGDTADVPYFFPNERKPSLSNPANRVILPGGYTRNARGIFMNINPDLYVMSEVLSSHLISVDALTALIKDDADGFIAIRERSILKAESVFLARLGLMLDEGAGRSIDELDAN